MSRKTISDNKIYHIWKCLETGEETAVPPTFYADAGTPVSSETGDDMEYIRTEIEEEEEETGIAALKDKNLTEVEGPYECPHCGGHFSVDTTFLDQVQEDISCMYCKKNIKIPD